MNKIIKKIIPVINSILIHEEEILLLRRSPFVSSQVGKWSGVSGFLDPGQNPIDQAYQEIEEELELTQKDLVFLSQSEPIQFADSDKEDRIWLVYPFLFSVKDPQKILLNYENDRSQWIRFHQIEEFQTVVGLKRVIQSLLEAL